MTDTEHHWMHLTFEVEDGKEIHADIPWEPGQPFPEGDVGFRLMPSVVLYVREAVVNAFPRKEGRWGSLTLAGRLLADGTILPLMKDHVKADLDEIGLKHY